MCPSSSHDSPSNRSFVPRKASPQSTSDTSASAPATGAMRRIPGACGIAVMHPSLAANPFCHLFSRCSGWSGRPRTRPCSRTEPGRTCAVRWVPDEGRADVPDATVRDRCRARAPITGEHVDVAVRAERAAKVLVPPVLVDAVPSRLQFGADQAAHVELCVDLQHVVGVGRIPKCTGPTLPCTVPQVARVFGAVSSLQSITEQPCLGHTLSTPGATADVVHGAVQRRDDASVPLVPALLDPHLGDFVSCAGPGAAPAWHCTGPRRRSRRAAGLHATAILWRRSARRPWCTR